MYYVYVLRSIPFGNLYKGFCTNLESRLAEHNAGKTKSTKHYVPWEIVYYESFDSKDEAISRERYFKSAAGRRYLKKFI
ncbi:MAG: GIY-YIG nuclease family protein [Bacteroidales bacterium]|nr:GIY-YIG nuclease family protein [Bacteroidales bacterium]MBK8882534.1 GIY-YIG nuclease family protein [Bacteroidales bacterium]